MITIHLYNQWVELHEKQEVFLKWLQSYFSYNDYIEGWEKSTGQKFDEKRFDHCKSLAFQKFIPEGFKNWLSFTATGLYNDMITGQPFPKTYIYDGYQPLEKVKNGVLKYRSGLLRKVFEALQEFENEQGHLPELSFVDHRVNKIEWKKEPVYAIGKYDLRGDQIKALEGIRNTLSEPGYGKYYHSVLLNIAVGFGKTILIGCLIQNIKQYKVVLLYREKSLCMQAIDDYINMGFDVGVIAADQTGIKKYLKEKGQTFPKFDTITDFTICMVQSLSASVKKQVFSTEDFADVNGVFVDECEEGFAADKVSKIFDLFKPGIQVGYSGTPLDSPSTRQRLQTMSLFGSQFYKVTVSENNKNKVTLPAHVHIYLNRISDFHIRDGNGVKRKNSDIKISGIYTSEQRIETTVEILKEQLRKNRQILIYFGTAMLELGEALRDRLLQEPVLADAGIRFVTGDLEASTRATVYREFNKGLIKILIANRVIKRGINLPAIQTVINWEASDSKSAIIQAIMGRPCRLNGEDTYFEIIDFYDRGTAKIEQQSRARIGIYKHKDLGCKMAYHYLNLDGIPIS